MPLRESIPDMREVGRRTLGVAKSSLPFVGIVGAVALALGGGYFGYQWVTHSSRFAIAELEVSGNARLGEREITDLLRLGPNPNVFLADMGTLESRLEASPWIVRAEVSRLLPTGLEIEIQEEAAIAVVELDGLYLANEKGQLFKRANVVGGEVDGLSIVTGISRDEHLADPAGTQERLQFALDALHGFAVKTDRPQIGEVHLDARHGISLITFDDAIAIHIGMPRKGELAERYRAFDSAWHALDAEEHAAARSFRIADRTPSDRVTVAFAGN
ncbi:MAG: FtsQ-type POTRA domain-containing protein [Myxococcales bacterium]|nr:FtsQ-type POTRA domain-containing protein [Myxococcales bacterium]